MGAATADSGPGTKSPIKIFANIFISFIGAGVLGLPYAFKEAGVLEGFIVMTCVAVISIKAMLLIVACKYHLIQKQQPQSFSRFQKEDQDKVLLIKEEQENLLNGNADIPVLINKEEPHKPVAPGQELSYGDVGYYALGYIGKLLVDLAIVVSQLGFCCAYLIFISENLSDYIQGLELIHWLWILLPPLCLLCLLRHLSSLAVSSLFAQISNLLAFGVVFWFDFEHLHNVSINPREFSAEGLPFFLCIAIYCYEGAGMILALESSLDKDVRASFTKYLIGTLFCVTTLYISFGICGYLSFGEETNAIITLNLPKGEGIDFAIMVKSCLCLALFFTYPVMMFPVIAILERVILPLNFMPWHSNILRVCMVLATGIIVLGIPNFANLMALVGATCCTMLAFILPGLFHLKLFSGSLTKCEFAFDVFIIILGIAGAIIGTLDALYRLHEDRNPIQEVFRDKNLTSSTAMFTTTFPYKSSTLPHASNSTVL